MEEEFAGVVSPVKMVATWRLGVAEGLTSRMGKKRVTAGFVVVVSRKAPRVGVFCHKVNFVGLGSNEKKKKDEMTKGPRWRL